MTQWIFSFLGWLFIGSLHAYFIVFVHIGQFLPKYLHVAVAQARCFNPTCPIYLIANESALRWTSQLIPYDVTFISCESLPRTQMHDQFLRTSRHDRESAHGYWRNTVERFFYLHELIETHQLTDVFHLENDVMLYADLETLMPVFQQFYQGMIGATFELDSRCCPGFFYISDEHPLAELMQYFAKRAHLGEVDMEMIGQFKQLHCKTWIDSLPTIPPDYLQDHALTTGSYVSQEPGFYTNRFEAFASLFDAAAIGIYLGGVDPYFHLNSMPGIDSLNSVFKPSFCAFQWEVDHENRRVPYAIYREKKIPINNLHISCKQLDLFFSRP